MTEQMAIDALTMLAGIAGADVQFDGRSRKPATASAAAAARSGTTGATSGGDERSLDCRERMADVDDEGDNHAAEPSGHRLVVRPADDSPASEHAARYAAAAAAAAAAAGNDDGGGGGAHAHADGKLREGAPALGAQPSVDALNDGQVADSTDGAQRAWQRQWWECLHPTCKRVFSHYDGARKHARLKHPQWVRRWTRALKARG
jgi:hypothetical protein